MCARFGFNIKKKNLFSLKYYLKLIGIPHVYKAGLETLLKSVGKVQAFYYSFIEIIYEDHINIKKKNLFSLKYYLNLIGIHAALRRCYARL